MRSSTYCTTSKVPRSVVRTVANWKEAVCEYRQQHHEPPKDPCVEALPEMQMRRRASSYFEYWTSTLHRRLLFLQELHSHPRSSTIDDTISADLRCCARGPIFGVHESGLCLSAPPPPPSLTIPTSHEHKIQVFGWDGPQLCRWRECWCGWSTRCSGASGHWLIFAVSVGRLMPSGVRLVALSVGITTARGD